ncbi:tRNA (guanine(10)-N(2))-dimethyltransferase [Pyrococcus abyssi]|uniref:tRNA (guanine(26)-N(2))-dimethyltransferase n=1 Tax=Pyrococcus abyssi (strain GE5 / Orsay) TaxID=272844 RepID=TRM1_PYRAB|nr:tRNA (guanine(10)-N(2))-dimethyltransferase [Pyrococcus abyssi]Q9V1P3.2 RecName: Full=tRNA (guanine(26)-N(2))-dimethyltransferase; AltName: Full=tRNA 2,2-dimethylguanosine-26 methyltransferase; AltName: Full=tRNA(guanine-26,N(2)-N(2)) methyltransferase; AltName: Full=tRNA(m(2,2)G26)dimethyltransferase [Pyrococcus abyssi GE5]CCE69762.1 TPA: N(2),N(2)-dimethylguanosine tRNA methyltransferase [Pyrococcus abyssi GE5]
MELVEVLEGKAKILTPKAESIYDAPVFYNPRMALNRDIAVVLLNVLKPRIVLDALSATGIRGIRFALETPAEEIWMNDISEDAYNLMKKNVLLNFKGELEESNGRAVLKSEKTLVVNHDDANRLMAEKHRYFHFIDLDPFGSPMEFLDTALRSVKRKGILGITATDGAPLCGAHPKACMRKYLAVPLRGELCHEVGTRILVGVVARYAAKYDLGIEVILAYYKDHYFRAFIKLKDGARKGDESLENLGYIYFDESTGKFEVERSFLPSKPNAYGPVWLGPLKSQEIVEEMLEISQQLSLARKKQAVKLLKILKDELDVPLFYDTHGLGRRLKIEARKIEEIINELRSLGYRASRTHFSPTGVKTDAPYEVFVNVLSSAK